MPEVERRISPPKIGLVTWLTLKSVIFFVLLVSIISFMVYNFQKGMLVEKINAKNALLTETYAGFIGDAKQNFEDLLIVDYLSRLKRFPTVKYAVILDDRARVLFHTDMREVGKTYQDAVSLKAVTSAADETIIQEVLFEGESVIDYARPVFVERKKVASLRVGFSRSEIEASLEQIKENITVIFIAGVIIVIVGSFILNSGLGVGISKVREASDKVSRGELPDEIDYHGAGEIGYLARVLERLFNKIRAEKVAFEEEKKMIKKEDEFLVQSIGELIQEGLIILGPENKIIFANETAGKLAGFSLIGCMDKHMLEVIKNAELMEFLNYCSQRPNILQEKEIFSLNCTANIKVIKDVSSGKTLGTAIILKK